MMMMERNAHPLYVFVYSLSLSLSEMILWS